MKLLYSHQTGRSMIEMLGVLAIIGILSIGAIAGYSKAMFNYKMQRAADEYVIFFQNVLQYYKELIALRNGQKAGEGNHYPLAELLNNMEMLPTNSWTRNGNYIYDSLNNRISPFIRKENNRLNFDLIITTDKTSSFVCEALYRNVIMQFSEYLYSVATRRQDNETAQSSQYYYGDFHCNKKSVSEI